MSGLKINIQLSTDISEELQEIAAGLRDKAPLHAHIAADAEAFVKKRGAATAATEHKTANRLGANPTGHLADAYQAIEGQSSATEAILLVPSGGRLAAAFGPVTIRPKSAKFLTIPVARDSYGKRAGEFGDELFFLRVGPKKQAVLARRQERVETGGFNRTKGKRFDNTKPLEVLYILAKESNIPEDRNLIPFDDLEDAAVDSAEAYLDDILEGSTP
jgi:hypothetical protein